jgi:hypothetical protein
VVRSTFKVQRIELGSAEKLPFILREPESPELDEERTEGTVEPFGIFSVHAEHSRSIHGFFSTIDLVD